jgi:diaminopimelate epimerase
MQFFKLQATGNDFIFFLDLAAQLQPAQIAQLCDRHLGIGADGLIVLKEKKSTADYEWTFFNPDGHEAEMCGNAARCAMRLLELKKNLKRSKVFTRAGFFNGVVLDDKKVSIETTIPARQITKKEFIFEQRFAQGYLTNTGVPHLVIPLQSLNEVQGRAQELAPFIHDNICGDRGANLTFYSPQSKQELNAVTLERGVNDFTLSCGTGVIAAAQVHSYLQKTPEAVRVQTPGGALSVEFTSENTAKLLGDALFVFEGSIT